MMERHNGAVTLASIDKLMIGFALGILRWLRILCSDLENCVIKVNDLLLRTVEKNLVFFLLKGKSIFQR